MRGFSQQFRLPDGRMLGYDDHGPPSGAPVFLFHGTPSSRYDWYLFGSEALTRKLWLRGIVPDRPGLGLSAFQPNRQISDWPGDVSALADALGLERFAVLGYSGGGPYVMACALQIPERLTVAGIIGGAGLHSTPGTTAGIDPGILRFLKLARDTPRLAQGIFSLAGTLARRSPPWLIALAMTALPEPERRILARPGVQQVILSAFLEALHTGPRGVCWDTALMIRPWRFDPQDVTIPVFLWHGEEDHLVSPSMVRRLAAAIPYSRATFLPGEGHVSMLVNHAGEILSEIIALDHKVR